MRRVVVLFLQRGALFDKIGSFIKVSLGASGSNSGSNSFLLSHYKQQPPEKLRFFKGFSGDPSEIRTPDPLIKSQMLYRLS